MSRVGENQLQKVLRLVDNFGKELRKDGPEGNKINLVFEGKENGRLEFIPGGEVLYKFITLEQLVTFLELDLYEKVRNVISWQNFRIGLMQREDK